MKEKKKESANDYCFVLLMSEMRDKYTKLSNAKIESNQFIFEEGLVFNTKSSFKS